MADVRVLAGRYELGELLGRGGMGEVWAAWDPVVHRRVAVKLMRLGEGMAEEERLFLREAQTAGGLSHPGVVTVHDLGRDGDGTLYLVMELVGGRDLGKVLREEGPPAVATAVEWAAQAAAALAAAHEAGVVHRDLKPANLMLTRDGTVKILDFGIARFATTTTTASQVVGTLAYMPPERLLGQPSDARGDLYALGCVLSELLTGEPPFAHVEAPALMFAQVHTEPTPPGATRSGVWAGLDALVAELLAKSPRDRPATAQEVAARLRSLGAAPDQRTEPNQRAEPDQQPLADRPPLPDRPTVPDQPTEPDPHPVAAPPPASPARPVPPTRRRALAVGAGAVLAAAGVTTYALSTRKEPGGTEEKPGGQLLARLRDRGAVTLGIAGERPFGYLKNGRPTGAGPAVAARIFERLGVPEIKARQVAFDALVPAVVAGEIQVVAAGLFITPERCGKVLFADPDHELKDGFLLRSGKVRDPASLTSYDALVRLQRDGLKVACLTDSQLMQYATKDEVEGLLPVPDAAAALSALNSGRADAFVGTHLMVRDLAKGDTRLEASAPVQPVVDGKAVHNAGAFAFARTEKELRDAFNVELRRLKKSGELLRVVEPFGFSEAEMTDLTARDLCD
ncbi:serine/threonine-protein kinase [Streptomyces cavernicola]|uniref:non-specific serine/threonine protein kinase n=1 Tax=Streptomyces cavernicola TaxID=3043613 RepID=A0ABT6SA10_9ACTN|nr:serine/threonine-protein kinase [Streptomyces sp. B-S-A6]MDI3405017.1 serine/threonine-protein kinase [Streptomyces sp. B-S-A6]